MKKVLFVSIITLLFVTGCEKEYYCDSGDTLKGTSCITQKKTPAQVEYYCSISSYSLVGNKCEKSYGMAGKISIAADTRYYCTSGYLQGSSCIIETTYNAYVR